MGTKKKVEFILLLIIVSSGAVITLQTFVNIPYVHYILYIIYYMILIYYVLLINAGNKRVLSSIRYRSFVILLILWILFSLCFGIFTSKSSFFDILFHPSLFLPYTFVFFYNTKDGIKMKQILNLIFIGNIVYLFFVLYYILNIYASSEYLGFVNFIENSGKYFVYSSIFSLFLFKDNTRNQKIICLLTIVIGLLLALFIGRRTMSFVLILSIIFSVFQNELFSIKSFLKKCVVFSLLISVCLFFIYLFLYTDIALFETLRNRIDRDSRTGVVDEFYADLDGADYVFGRGIGGTFFTRYTGLGESEGTILSYRHGIETGYLDLILKGGGILLFLFVIICSLAIYRGFFIHKDYYHRGMSFFILLFIIELVPNGTLLFTFRYYLLWYSIYFCLLIKSKKHIGL